MPEVRDKYRAEKLLECSIGDSDQINDPRHQTIHVYSKSQNNVKPKYQKRVVVAEDNKPFALQILEGKSKLMHDPYDEFDPHHRIS